jgi:hypothetical protein
VADNSFVRMPDALAEIIAMRGLADQEARRKAFRRTAAGAAVVALHILLLFVFVISERIPIVRHVVQPIETILILTPQQQRAPLPPPPKRILVAPTPEIVEPIHIPPIVAPPPEPTEQTKEQNVLREIGQAIACGASRYEYLSPAERRLCKRIPWKMPPDKNLAIAPPPPPPIGQLTGAEAEARFRATARPCPILQNTPCIDKVIYGDAPH